ncbi:MAG: septation protein IspZ [Methylobacteriaceae bacterium]|jgi:intracellular septation protein|nr:septation protein IspZ [Methylobacteriaceae bacterium]
MSTHDEPVSSPPDSGDEAPKATESERPGLKMALDTVPLVLFCLANFLGPKLFGWTLPQQVSISTAVFIVAMTIAVFIGYRVYGTISMMTKVSLVLVLILGGFTVLSGDQTFLQIKFTLVNVLFGAVIFIGLAMGKNLLAMLMGQGIRMTEEGWRQFSIRFGLFFFFLAGLNEVLRRMLDWDTWLNLKLFVVLPVTMVFAVLQVPLMMRHMIPEKENGDGEAAGGGDTASGQ